MGTVKLQDALNKPEYDEMFHKSDKSGGDLTSSEQAKSPPVESQIRSGADSNGIRLACQTACQAYQCFVDNNAVSDFEVDRVETEMSSDSGPL